MARIVKIYFVKNKRIACCFDNSELRVLNLHKSLNDKYADKILADENIFRKAKIGQLGEIYWSDIAEMIDTNGKTIACEYDISPEFAYANSTPV